MAQIVQSSFNGSVNHNHRLWQLWRLRLDFNRRDGRRRARVQKARLADDFNILNIPGGHQRWRLGLLFSVFFFSLPNHVGDASNP